MAQASPFWRTNSYLLGYAILYAVSLFVLNRVEHFGLSEPLLVLVVVGLGFSGLAWWFTRRVVPPPFAVRRPGRETMLLAAYMAPVGAFSAWGLNVIESGVRTEPSKSIVILAAKIVVLVLVPLALFHQFWGYRIRDFLLPAAEWRRQVRPALWMSLVVVLFQLVFGHGLSEIRHSGVATSALIAGIPFAYLWLVIEVGLVEEFFFRALLQSRLSAWLHSEVGGVVLMSLLFGLAHAPGLHYRTRKTLEAVGSHPSWLMALGYSVVIVSVAGFFLGVLWARTRNLLLLMAVHAAGDLVPNLAPMVRNWF